MNKIEALLYIVGIALSFGSITTFIVMNLVVGSSTDAMLIYHQRLFAATISKALTIPGVWMLFGAMIVAVFLTGRTPLADKWAFAQLALAILIFINTMFFIRPLVSEVGRLAEQSAAQGQILKMYLSRKKLEDRFGKANFLMIATTILLAAFKR